MQCYLCPRKCGVDRKTGELGFCKMPDEPVVARAAAHFGEEPCISGPGGSGTVFFSGCNMHCVFCQNRSISFEGFGRTVSVSRLAEIFGKLESTGVNNINLVTATHFTDKVTEALKIAKPKIPVVWNSSGYERVETLRMLDGLVQVYMPDLKYMSPRASTRYSAAPDYPETAKSAISEMYRQVGNFVMGKDGLLKSGVLIRHLVLPERIDDCFDVIDWVAETFPKNGVLLSIMSQFTPMANELKFPELSRRLTGQEYKRVKRYLDASPIENGYYQEPSSATDELIPNFDLTGL